MTALSKSVNAIAIIAYRDILKFFKDKARIIATFIFPIIFIGIMGNSFQASFGSKVGFNYLVFTFTGVLAQTLFQSSASGIISLIEDRENDFSQEIFISPIPRLTIILGKIVGESSVAFIQAVGIVIFGFLTRIPFSMSMLIQAIPVLAIACLFGSAFGVIVLANLSSQRAANQIFPFIILPQFFISGIFSPVKDLPLVLDILSKIAPLTYIVDLLRGVYYAGSPEYSAVVARPVWLNLIVIAVLFVVFITLGTYLFVKNERNR